MRRRSRLEGLLVEGKRVLSADADATVMDAMVIAAAQKVEHDEIATYGSLCTWGEVLGLHEATDLLRQNLNDEKAADDALTDLAKQINAEAAAPAA